MVGAKDSSLAKTPRIAEGTLKETLHELAPAHHLCNALARIVMY